MNLYLHGIDADPCPVHSGVDSLAGDPGSRFSLVLTNPLFGKKSTIATGPSAMRYGLRKPAVIRS